jgi:hypothetical protein
MGGESTSPLSYPYADQSQPIQALSFTKWDALLNKNLL